MPWVCNCSKEEWCLEPPLGVGLSVYLDSCFEEVAEIILKLFFLFRRARGKKGVVQVLLGGLEDLELLDPFQ
jgi:hypothetical protein